MHFSFSTFLSVSRHIPGHTVFKSHFPCFSIFSQYSMSYTVCFSFFTFFIFSPYSTSYSMCFSFFTFFNVYGHIPCPTVCVSHFPRFSVFVCKNTCPTVHILHFSHFLLFLAIFQVLPGDFLIFLVGQFSCHISGPTVCISHFHVFHSFFSYSGPTVCVSHFTCFSVLSLYPCPTVYIFHFSRFSVFLSSYFITYHVSFSFSSFVRFLAIVQVVQC